MEIDKIKRMVGLVGADEAILRSTVVAYRAARAKRKGPKAAHTVAMSVAEKALGGTTGSWDYASWAQNLVDDQGV